MLSKEQILAADDIKTEIVDVPEWGGSVIIRMMSGTARDAYEASMVGFKNGQRVADLTNMRAKLVAATLVDESGEPLFADEADIVALAAKSASALERLFKVAQRINGLGNDSVEEAQKN
ncbi:conserved hypothetical protein [Cupriavidus taiwanensis]|uniref:hypothetical protein n=1 Tax=Cupriavidus taiwanensis TaxID=164546 RepID=UPI000E13343F|nr:hypothetical protein [Cupriavidus taiwanensis]SOZ99450.1 conserved hypothetical protein [Cupriavidus taiwanensis]